MAITIEVPWTDPYHTQLAWNELLAWTVETFGLPGERVVFHTTETWMQFVFKYEQDALLFQLKTAGRRVSNEEIAVDFIGGLINR